MAKRADSCAAAGGSADRRVHDPAVGGRIPVARGRGFAQADARDDASVIIVTESTARRLWPGEDPLGKRLLRGGHQDTVIGVAKDAQVSHLSELSSPYLYFPAGPRDNVRT